MHTKANGVGERKKLVTLRVQAITQPGETVVVSGDCPQLGSWNVTDAVPLSLEDAGRQIWGGRLTVPADRPVHFRYLVVMLVPVASGGQEVVVRRWEAPIQPRYLGSYYSEMADQIDILGSYDGMELIEPGWLTTDTVIQLKLYNNPITIWKRKLKNVPFTFKVTPIDLERRSEVMNEQDSNFVQQSQFGHLYNPSEYVIFQARVFKPHTIAYMVDFYSHQDSSLPEHVGFCYILPSNLRDAAGRLTMPISGKKQQQPIGQMNEHAEVQAVCRVENVLENTVASFNYAARHGADMVELDVQLSKDLVPVIYHDYNICISMKKKRSQGEHELLEMAVRDLTAKQLQMLKLSPAKSEGGHYFEEDDAEDNQPFPTLQHVLDAVDQEVGFNIEIKCPMQLHDGSWEAGLQLDLNEYIDLILKEILEHAGSRIIILSCFHPDICTMVRLKQNKYPLLFLTQGVTERYPPYLDTRTSSVPMAAFFALSMSLLVSLARVGQVGESQRVDVAQGINVHAEDLLRECSYISFVKSHKLVLFCWGEDINHSDVVQRLKDQGVDGVIYDK
ncbi:GPCPD1 [Cordylochernes scorpioides]|uniref:GPCPD1 n=1 Tax=Cordylochernes scorpioides TaxID=51811 RepID=A0ABY6KSA9_9ARAC|nr:GPCPD1 [Cordylochernes scorpioides]